MEKVYPGCILIECPSTIFQLYVKNEDELSKIQIFMRNIQSLRGMELKDIYNWCIRQGIAFDTRFNYRKGLTPGKTLCAFLKYFRLKLKYKRHLLPV